MKLVKLIVIILFLYCFPLYSSDTDLSDMSVRLIRAYPEYIKSIEGNNVVFTDGSRMPLREVIEKRTYQNKLDHPDLIDQISVIYPRLSRFPIIPGRNDDPGRIRYAPFFEKLYGNSENEIKANLVQIIWMPKSSGKILWVTSVNQIDQKLIKISAELDEMPDSLKKYVIHPSGTYVHRKISGTDRLSMHSYGIAIDIDSRYADYWKWGRSLKYKNQIPMEIVAVFYRNGFIWGGAWYHYDTMHFEYRPELIADDIW